MSLMEDIKAAEKAAEETRKAAINEAKNLVHDAQEKAETEANALVAGARQEAKNTVAKAGEEGKAKAAELVASRTADDAKAAQAALTHVDEAVAYIMEKVVV